MKNWAEFCRILDTMRTMTEIDIQTDIKTDKYTQKC